MGGSISATFHTYTPAEIAENLRVIKLQDVGFEFVTKIIYHGIPIRSGRKNKDPRSAIWIEPQPDLVNELLTNKDKTAEDMLSNVPSGIMIDSKCKIKMFFTFSEIEYTMDIEDVVRYNKDCRDMSSHIAKTINNANNVESVDELAETAPPLPPVMDSVTTTEINIRWDKQLPYPVGIILHVEVQYALWNENPTFSDSVGSSKAVSEKAPGIKWHALVSKVFSRANFLAHSLAHLTPGSSYCFRIRYRCNLTWSAYSECSECITTLPDRPARPAAPVCIAITPTAIEMQWAVHGRDNGAPITAYVLRGRSVGDSFVELYRGTDAFSYLALGMYPEFAYSFQLAAANRIGLSDYSTMVSVQTPQRIKQPTRNSVVTSNVQGGFSQSQVIMAMQCRDAWRECWDPRTERPFYFNKILATRQLEKPSVLKQKEEESRLLEEETQVIHIQTPKEILAEKELMFRKKRYRLLRALHKNKYAVVNQSNNSSPLRNGRGSVDNSPVTPGARSTRGSFDTAANTSSHSPNRNGNNNADTASAVSSLVYNSIIIVDDTQTTNTMVGSSSSPTLIQSNNAKLKEIMRLELRREFMLADCFRVFRDMKLADFYRRVKVEFAGEAGIDSGGLSKEAFLLLSKQAAIFAGPHCKQWMVPLLGSVVTEKQVEKDITKTTSGERESEAIEGLFFVSNTTISTANSIAAAIASITQKAPSPVAVDKTKIKSQQIVSAVLSKEVLHELNSGLEVTSGQFFAFLGRLLGKALFDRQLVDFPLSSLLLQHMLGGLFEEKVNSSGNIVVQKSGKSPPPKSSKQSPQPAVSPSKSPKSDKNAAEILTMLAEIQPLDSLLHKQLHWIATHDITNIIYETFSVCENDVTLPLCASGDSKEVCEANKLEYVQLILLYKSKYSVSDSLFPFLEAFHEVVPLGILKEVEVTKEELNLMLNGKASVDVEEIRAYCVYQSSDPDFNETCDTIVRLWRLFRELGDADRRALLKFFTGSSRVPLDGYDPPLNITQGADMEQDSLPRAHTCFNQLVLPEYSSYEKFKDRVMFAVRNTEGFALS